MGMGPKGKYQTSAHLARGIFVMETYARVGFPVPSS